MTNSLIYYISTFIEMGISAHYMGGMYNIIIVQTTALANESSRSINVANLYSNIMCSFFP